MDAMTASPHRELAERVLVDPLDRSPLHVEGEELVSASGRRFPIRDGIPVLLPDRLDGITQAVARFYSATPFQYTRQAAEAETALAMTPQAAEFFGRLAPDQLVADVGSGPAGGSLYAARLGLRVISLDVSLESLRRLARHRVSLCVQATNAALPLADACLDAVISDGVIHHTACPRRAFAEVVRVLRPGGHLFLRVYAHEGYYRRLYQDLGAVLRRAEGSPWGRGLVRGPVFHVYALVWSACRGGPRRSRDVHWSLFRDYFLTPQAVFFPRRQLEQWIAEAGLTIDDYRAYRNTHGYILRKGRR